MTPINILSVCDGMSCLQITLKELGIPVNKYYASEIDKFAIKQTQHNFPDTIQLGDITKVDVSKLDRIDFLGGGTPCMDFSFAGKRKGMSTACNEQIFSLPRYLELKSDGFEFEGESYLFWEYMRILNDIRKYNPDVKFLLENVEMGKKWERILSEAIGVYGVHINSTLVSAQNRKRIYWTNIRTKEVGLFGELHTDIPQPEDRGILLKDILEGEVDEKYYLSDTSIGKLIKHKERHKAQGHGFGSKPCKENEKMNTLSVKGTYRRDLISVGCDYRRDEGLRIKKDGKSGTLLGRARNDESCEQMICIAQRGRDNGQNFEPNLSIDNYRIRRLTPVEVSRLQTVPDWYKWECSDTQIYKMCGNGWNIETIKHILKFLNHENTVLHRRRTPIRNAQV